MIEKRVSYCIKLCNNCPFFVFDMLGAKCYEGERDMPNVKNDYGDIEIPDWCPLPDVEGDE